MTSIPILDAPGDGISLSSHRPSFHFKNSSSSHRSKRRYMTMSLPGPSLAESTRTGAYYQMLYRTYTYSAATRPSTVPRSCLQLLKASGEGWKIGGRREEARKRAQRALGWNNKSDNNQRAMRLLVLVSLQIS